MKLMTLTAFWDGADEEYEGCTFACVARRPSEANRQLRAYLGEDCRNARIEVEEVVFSAPMDGPARVLGPLAGGAFAWPEGL